MAAGAAAEVAASAMRRGGRAVRSLAAVLALVGALAWGLTAGAANAETQPPPAEPMLRIDPGMHTAMINRIGVSADGRLLATGSDDKTVRLWAVEPDGRSLRLTRTLRVPIGPGNDGKIFAVALSPDGRLVAAGGWDASDHMYLFDADSGQLVQRLGPLPNVILDLAFSPDGSRLAAGLGKNGIRVWRVSDGQPILTDTDYGGQVYGLAFAADGRLVTTSLDGKVRLYVASGAGKPKAAKAPSGGRPRGISFSPDGARLAVGYDDSTRVDVLDAGRLALLFSADTKGVDNGELSSVAWSADGTRLLASGRYALKGERLVLVWGQTGKGERRALKGPRDTVMDLEPWGTSVAVAGGDPAFGLLSSAGERLAWRDPVQADLRGKRFEHFLVSADGRQVRLGLKEWSEDPHLLDLAAVTLHPSPQAPANLASADTKSLAVDGWINTTAPQLAGKPLALKQYETARSLAVLPDKSGFILGSEWTLRRFDATGQEVWKQPVPSVVWGVNLAREGRLVIAAYGDGTLRWHRASDGRELLAVFMHVPADGGAKRLVAWTPKGYYTASPGAEDLIGWHVNRGWDQAADFFPASRFRDRFNRPDIVARVLDDLDEEVAIEAANTAAKRKRDDDILTSLPPVIEILSPMDGTRFSDGELAIEYLVRSPSRQPVTGVDVLIDGRPLGEGQRGLGRVDAAGITTSAEAVPGEGRFKMSVPLPPRDVELALVARTARSASEARRVRLAWGGATGAALPPGAAGIAGLAAHEKPKLYALLVGVSDYARADLKLAYAGKDARDMDAALKRQAGGLYREVETKLIADAEASAQSIRNGFGWLEKEVTAKDVGLVFLAGHGVTDQQQRFWFLPADGDPENLRGTAIAKSDFEEVLRGLPGKALMFIDACHAGKGIEKTRYVTRSGGGAADVTSLVNELASAENGIVMFASSTGRELSAEDPAWQNGAFTKAVVAGLTGSADYSKDGAITIKELDLWISEHVKQLTAGRQHPVSLKPETVPDFPLALAR